MKIWLIQIAEPLPLSPEKRLLRTGLLSAELISRGHQVVWWASAFSHQGKRPLADGNAEIVLGGGLTLQLLSGMPYEKNVSVRRYLNHRMVASNFRKLAAKAPEPDIVIASMPCHHLAFEAVRYANFRRIPVAVDVRDLWPDIFVDQMAGRFRGLARGLLCQDFFRLDHLLSNADAILTISKGYLQWALTKAGRSEGPDDRIFHLGYLRRSNGSSPNPSLEKKWTTLIGGRKAILFIGSFGVTYDLDSVVEAARRCWERRQDAMFILSGSGEQEKNITRLARGLPNVCLPGWLDRREIEILLNHSWAGLLAYVKGAPQGIPNKPFEYLSASLPLISSLEGEMAELIRDQEIGITYAPGDPEALAASVEGLLEDPVSYERMRARAGEFFRKKGDALSIYSAYADHIEALYRNSRTVL